ncbi:transposable element tc3 transposase [Caerostris extrusa]|uniref:Transposable element tc3 transposase n=1 Tax=Caerostris extrusa TaxID=172846 RepID=A0AAV4PF30_CAEEX|nr:transposable element tc3 transposase [Caerostris extrusa]
MRDIKGPITSSSFQRNGRPSTAAAVATTVEQTVQSMSAVAAHGECSAREVSRQTGVSYGSVWEALRITLKRYPYKLQHKQELKPPDFDSRRGFANLPQCSSPFNVNIIGKKIFLICDQVAF